MRTRFLCGAPAADRAVPFARDRETLPGAQCVSRPA